MEFISLKLVGLDCQRICDRVQKLVDEYVKSGKVVDNCLLDIRISNVSCTLDPELPKLENIKIPES